MAAIIRAAPIALQTRQLKRAPGLKQNSASDTAKETKSVAVPVEAFIEKPLPVIPSLKEPVVQLSTEDLVAQRQDAAQTLERESERERSRIFEAAERRGYAAGLEKGEQAAQKTILEQVERLASISSALYRSRMSVLEEAEAAAVEIVYTAICRIIGETAASRTTIINMVNQIVGTFRELDQLVVRLHPQDLELVQQICSDGAAEIDSQIALRADTSIKMGGCIVDSTIGSLDARLELQLARLSEVLLAVRENRDSVEAGI